MAKDELSDKINHLSDEHKNMVEKFVETLSKQEEELLHEKQDLFSIMKLSEKSFSEWDNEEDSIYNSM
ncbi:MAG: hypothetical protein HYZ54_03505 [Ignavibacteriae bacterium]|nr:hypothetical protein [Ignavibacteriota bacterium]